MTKYDEIMEKITLSPEARDRILENIADEVSSSAERKTNNRSSWKRYLSIAACCVLVAAGAAAASNNGLFDNLFGGSSADMGPEEYVNQSDDAVNEEGRDAELSEAEDPATSGATNDETDGKGSFAMDGSSSAFAPLSFESYDDLAGFVGFGFDYPAPEELGLDPELTGTEFFAYETGNGGYIAEVSYTEVNGNGDIRQGYYRKAVSDEDISGDYNEYDSGIEFDGEERSGSLSGRAGYYNLARWTSADGNSYAAYSDKGLTDKEWYDIIDNDR